MSYQARQGDAAKVCTVEGCGRRAHARGWCRAHYDILHEPRRRRRNERWKAKYRSNPEFQARVKANAKRSFMQDANGEERIRAWKKANPDKEKGYQRNYKARLKSERGVSHSAKWYPGKEVQVFANGSLQSAEVAAPAFMRSEWIVPIKLPWGEVVEFPTRQVHGGRMSFLGKREAGQTWKSK